MYIPINKPFYTHIQLMQIKINSIQWKGSFFIIPKKKHKRRRRFQIITCATMQIVINLLRCRLNFLSYYIRICIERRKIFDNARPPLITGRFFVENREFSPEDTYTQCGSNLAFLRRIWIIAEFNREKIAQRSFA